MENDIDRDIDLPVPLLSSPYLLLLAAGQARAMLFRCRKSACEAE